MKRRTFLLLAIFTTITKGFAKPKNKNELLLIKDVLKHLFPTTTKYNGADRFGAFEFLTFVSKHQSFDKNDFQFLLAGARKLYSLEQNFLSLNSAEKERVLREYEKLTIGQNWLSTLLNYGIEAMLSDPIYKGNTHMLGWKNVGHTPPLPTATKPFGLNNV